MVDFVEAQGEREHSQQDNHRDVDLLRLEHLLDVAAIALSRRICEGKLNMAYVSRTGF